MSQQSFFPFENKYLNEYTIPSLWDGIDFTTYYFTEYLINRRGQIKSNYSNKNLKTKRPNSRNSINPYVVKRVKFNNIYKTVYIHRLVACTFIKCINRQKYTQVNHIDGNRQNNHIGNLEWVTPSENMKEFKNEENKLQLKLL